MGIFFNETKVTPTSLDNFWYLWAGMYAIDLVWDGQLLVDDRTGGGSTNDVKGLFYELVLSSGLCEDPVLQQVALSGVRNAVASWSLHKANPVLIDGGLPILIIGHDGLVVNEIIFLVPEECTS